MKLSKSILRPTFFLTRRRHSTSPGKRRRGRSSSTLESTVEPSSPKVTCIGQVRVKSKRKSKSKQSRTTLSSSSRRGNHFGDASFRKTADGGTGDVREYSRVCSRRRPQRSPRNHQRWVHLPVSICEALSDFCCFFHCNPCNCQCQLQCRITNCNGCCSCSSCSCGSARACRWLLCLNNGGGGGGREIEVMVETEVRQRRHVFEDIEVRNGRIEVKGQSELEVEEAPRVSICIPPKNALLLMRCRSDPMKMAALANRISWAAAPASDFEQSPELQDEEEDRQLSNQASIEPVLEMEVKIEPEPEESKMEEEEEEEVESNMSSFEALLDQEARDQLHDSPIQEPQKPEEPESIDKLPSIDDPIKEEEEGEEEEEEEKEGDELQVQIPEEEEKEKSETAAAMEKVEENQSPVLPDCLLLMMCEPKLSMEVSKETWVRGADFIRWLPPRKPAKSIKTTCCHHDPPLKKTPKPSTKPPSLPPPPPPPATKKDDHQPPRSSCSLPAAAIEQKLVSGGGAYGPFALPRCKSEPIRTAAAKLMPAEPYRVGAAGVIS